LEVKWYLTLELYELRILIFLLLHGPARKSDLVKALGLNWNTLSSNLNKLIDKGLVIKMVTFSGRPTYVYIITSKGIKELERIFLELKESLEKAKYEKPEPDIM